MNSDIHHLLLSAARASIQHGLNFHTPLPYSHNDIHAGLLEVKASFVTLHLHQQLKGCIGTLKAVEPLIDSVCNNAYKAAFEDYRFKPVTHNELELLDIEISILSASKAIDCSSETQLLKQLKPGIDGITLQEQHHSATFLPTVWQQLPEPQLFLNHLKQKAGLAEDYWSDSIHFERYSVELIQ